ncbi:MAG: NAD(P)-binding domain-containing protein [Dehalococcoidia bacterium]
MRIAIIGTGRMAAGLGRGWLKAGHFVAFGSRQPEKTNPFHQSVGLESRIYGHEGAITAGEAVVLTIPYREVAPLVARYAELLRGKPVIDITNPFDQQPANGLSGAETTASAIGDGARVLAAFKGNFAGTLAEPVDTTGTQRDVLYCGDDQYAKGILNSLIEDLGFRPVDCGPLSAARALDLMVPLLLEMDRRLNNDTKTSHWKFHTP